MSFEYTEVLSMLTSPDTENRDLAMIGLENLEFETHFVRIFWLKKESNIDFEVWQVIVPELAKKMRKTSNLAKVSIDQPLSYSKILSIASHRENPELCEEELGFLMFMLAKISGLEVRYPDLEKRFKIVKND